MTAKRARYINPATGDYSVESGGFSGDDTMASRIGLALRTRKGSSAAAPWFGSRLHLVKTADQRGALLVQKYAIEALAHLEDSVDELTVVASVVAPGRIDAVVSWRRGASSGTTTYTPVGG